MEANPVTHPECRRACQYNRSMVRLNRLRVVMVVITGYNKEARLIRYMTRNCIHTTVTYILHAILYSAKFVRHMDNFHSFCEHAY